MHVCGGTARPVSFTGAPLKWDGCSLRDQDKAREHDRKSLNTDALKMQEVDARRSK